MPDMTAKENRRTGELHLNAAAACPRNETMFQGFEWYSPADSAHWRRLARAMPRLADLGVTKLWIPPATKGAWGSRSNGYDAYDLYDLGEFDQKGTIATKWGPKADLLRLARVAAQRGVGLLFDTVLNHKAGADDTEVVAARKVDPQDRQKVIGAPEEITAWTRFRFSGRNGAYRSFSWNHSHFTGVDYDHSSRTKAIWLFQGKAWADDVDTELGNFDYLMFADIDHSQREVRQELFSWAEWLDAQLDLAGLRLDAVKHFSRRFVRDLLAHMDAVRAKRSGHSAMPWFVVGEYVTEDRDVLAKYIEDMEHRLSLFDFCLLHNFSRASYEARCDLRTVFQGALCETKPANAVTFVTNHDTQAGQTLETCISAWFVPAAYALILLRADSGLPCVFCADLYGSFGPSREYPLTPRGSRIPPIGGGIALPRLMLARRLYAYGTQIDYFDSPECVGWVRSGHRDHSAGSGIAVLVNGGWQSASKRMFVGAVGNGASGRRGEVWTDLLGWAWGEVVIDEDGCGTFPVGSRSIAVWGPRTAPGRELVDGYRVWPM